MCAEFKSTIRTARAPSLSGNGFTTLDNVFVAAAGPGDNTAAEILGGFIHILNSDVSTVFANPSTVQIVLRGSGATTNVRFANGRLVATGPASIVEAARRESGAVVKINNTELRPATTSGTPSCFSVFQQNCTAASCL